MRIKITPKFTEAQLRADIKKRVKAIHQGFLEELEMIGEEFVKNARENGNYKDQTGNLRNSIGYVLFENGKPIRENIQQTVPSKGGDKNAATIARMMARKVAQKHGTRGLLLVCIAGMDYAAAVESRGFDVISSSTIIAKNDLKAAVASWEKQAKGFKIN